MLTLLSKTLPCAPVFLEGAPSARAIDFKGGSDPSKWRDAQNRVLNRGRIAMISVGEK